MEYILDDYIATEKLFRFTFKNGKWLAFDLYNDFPNYKCPFNSGVTDLTHMTCLEDGSIKLFNTNQLREKSTLIKFYEENGKMYKVSTQTEYDKYKNKTEPDSDNAKVFRILNNQKKSKIKVTYL